MYLAKLSIFIHLEDEKLRLDLEKVEQLESKVTKELSDLRVKIDEMTKDLVTYSDLETQRQEADDLKQVKDLCACLRVRLCCG